MSIWLPPPVDLIPPSNQVLKQASLIMTPDQFKAAATAAVLVGAPGPGKAVIPVSWAVQSVLNGVGYSGVQNLRLRYEGDATALCSTASSIITVTGSSNMLVGLQGAGFAQAYTTSAFDPRNKRVWARCEFTITGGHANDRIFVSMVYYIASLG